MPTSVGLICAGWPGICAAGSNVAVVWLGAKRHTGRGEASSRLAFDYLAPREVGPSA